MEKWTEITNVPELGDVLKLIPPDLNAYDSKQDVKYETNIEPRSILNQKSKTHQSVQKKSSSSLSKWLIGTVAVILATLFTYSLIQKQSDIELYNEVVSNSFESEEDFSNYINKFYRDLEFYGIYPKKPKTQIIKFSKLDQLNNTTHIHGLSYGIDDDDKIEIYINPSTWDQFDKPLRYFLIYHELAHDVLNVADLEAIPENEGELMYPVISSYENINMDDFIESTHALFEKHSNE